MGLISSLWVKLKPRFDSKRREGAGRQPFAIDAGELEGVRQHRADLRIQRLHQLPPRAQMARLHGLRRNIQNLGRLFDREPFDLPQDKYCAEDV